MWCLGLWLFWTSRQKQMLGGLNCVMELGFSVENLRVLCFLQAEKHYCIFFSFFFCLSWFLKQFARDWLWCYAALWIQRHLMDIWAWGGVSMQECARLPLSTLNSTTPLFLHKNAILLMAVTVQTSPWWQFLLVVESRLAQEALWEPSWRQLLEPLLAWTVLTCHDRWQSASALAVKQQLWLS